MTLPAELEFRAEDFKDGIGRAYGNSATCAEIANDKLRAWLEKAPVVWLNDWGGLSDEGSPDAKRTARLVCIEPIVRDTAESLLKELVKLTYKRATFSGEQVDVVCERARKLLEASDGE